MKDDNKSFLSGYNALTPTAYRKSCNFSPANNSFMDMSSEVRLSQISHIDN
jgi:hypothetical protein